MSFVKYHKCGSCNLIGQFSRDTIGYSTCVSRSWLVSFDPISSVRLYCGLVCGANVMNKSFVKCNANDFPIILTPQASLALKAEVLHISKIFYVSPVDCSFFQSTNDSPAHWFFFSLQVGRLAVSVFQCAGFLIILLIWSFCLSVILSIIPSI